MPATGARARPPVQEVDETFFEWLAINGRQVAIAVVLVCVIVGGLLLYRSAKEQQAAQAEAALTGPLQAVAAGNLPLAQSDLKKLITRFAGTPAAAQAAIMLAETYYDQQKYQDGIAVLTQAASSGSASDFAPAMESLIGAGYAQQGRYHEAAAHFLGAASRSRFPGEQQRYQAQAARAYGNAGDVAAATALWSKLAADPKSPQAPEARLRLGELTAHPAGKA